MSHQGSLEELRVQLFDLKAYLENCVDAKPELYSWCFQPLIESLSQSIAQIDEQINNAPRQFRNYWED